ncbi:MAG: 2'-5' RNA ligase family protein [Saprospiraceae bacterium]|nr:2'-5' RNA ligase family protein [Saprospiraceae bacterium]
MSLFFIAVLPDDEIQAEVTSFKQTAAERFDSARALTSPPHITLIPPFRWKAERLPALLDSLKEFDFSEAPFELELNGFDVFEPRVIFVAPSPNEVLNNLQQELKNKLKEEIELSYRDHFGFHPHMTIAFKDLTESNFAKAWAWFKQVEYKRYFIVDSISLLQHNGQRWIVHSTYSL